MVARHANSVGFLLLFLFLLLLSACGGSGDISGSNESGNTPSPSPTPPSDTTAPIPTGSSPLANAVQVSVGTVIIVTFNEPVALSSLNTSNFSLNPAVPGNFSISGTTARFTPSNPLAASTRYTVSLQGVRDLANNSMVGIYSFSFTTDSALASNCAAVDVLCVDDTAGATQEYSDIPAAVSAVQAGQTVLVHDGIYTGFELARSGSNSAPIVIRAAGTNAVISRSAPTGDGIRLQNASYVTVEGFILQGGANTTNPINARCIAARGATAIAPMLGNVLRGNRCTDAGLECFYLSQFGGGLIENNFIRGCGRAGGARNHGIYLANAGSDNTVIRANTISTTGSAGAESNGIHMNGDLSIGGDGLISGVLIDANTIHDNTQNGLNLDGVQNTTLRNNLVYGNTRHGLRAYAIDGAAGPQGLVATNNTLIATNSGWAMKLSEDGGGHTFFNNILLGATGSLCVANTSFRADHNAVDNRLSLNNEASILSLTAWRTQSGQDTNSFVDSAAGLFLNASANDYRLATASAARDAGITSFNSVNAPAVDISGIPRPQGTRFDLGAFEAMTATGGATTYYLAPAPAGSDSNPGTSAQPWATFIHAFSRMQAGQVLEVKNGVYNQNLGTWVWSGGNMVPVSQPPNGNPNAPTIVRGESVGGVTINGSLSVIGWSYVNIENFTFTNGGAIDGGSRYIEVRRSGFNGGIGTAHSSYILKEDIWAWGSNRYVISNYQANHIVDHRVIARLDNMGSAPTLPVGAISQYETDYSVIAHGLFFDVTGTFQQPYALVYSSRPPIGMNRLYGLIGFNAGTQLGGIYPGDAGGGGHEINNSVIHGTSSYGVNFNSPGPNQVLNSTIFGNSGAAISGHHNITVANNILLNNAGGVSATIVSCSNNLLAASGIMGGCTGNDTTTVPTILYLPRSPIAGKGANIESRYNIGLSNGEYTITGTTDPLWPWPHEAIIKRDMCAGTTTGWCATNKSLTRYIWEYLGNSCPVDICG